MIQRIQSLYLSLTILLSLLFLKGGFLTFIDNSGSVIKITFRGIITVTDGQGIELIDKLLLFSALIIFIPALSLITILFYKNRKIQICLALIGVILATGLILVSVYYSYVVISSYSASIVIGIKMVIPVLIFVFCILSYTGIRKDDRLIKSYDRLR